jgi:DNA-directed RNA polymerase subunit beta'
VAVSRSGELGIIDDHGRERERYKVPYGASSRVNDGDPVKAGQDSVATWDPHTHPIVTEVAGHHEVPGLHRGVTVIKQVDEITGLSSTVVIDPSSAAPPARTCARSVRLVDAKGKDLRSRHRHAGAYPLPPAPSWSWRTAQKVGVGDVIARIPQESSKTRDITGGLPRVADLFEARKPKEPAILAEHRHGQLRQGHQGQAAPGHHRREGEHEELIPKWRT